MLTYRLVPEQPPNITLAGRYGYAHAAEVIRASLADYREVFSGRGD